MRLDLAEYSQGFEKFYADELKIIKPIDIAKVPNFNPDQIYPQFYQASDLVLGQDLFRHSVGVGAERACL